MAQRTCDRPDCEKPHRAKGLCAYHYRLVNPPIKAKAVACPTCGTVTMKRDSDRRFCSLLCRDVWRCDQPDDPMHHVKKRKSALPDTHPVMVLIRQRREQERRALLSPIRLAFEAGDWPGLLAAIRSDCIQVNDCLLWSRTTDRSSYPRIFIGKREYRVHRLVAQAVAGGVLDSHMPVHHKCAERWCCNPDHLQVVTPHENTAEMLERNYYLARIAVLESALRDVAPDHAAIRPGLRVISPAA